jgi:cytochrome c oxidase assembly protein subunit 16
MPAFPTQVRRRPIHKTLNKHPALFGVPFLLVIVGSSFALSQFTQTKYDYQDQKTSAVRIHH